MIKHISNKIIFSVFTLFLILVLFLSIFFNNLFREMHLSVIKKEMKEKVEFINLFFSKDRGIDFINKIHGAIKLRITFIQEDGTVVADTNVKSVSLMDNHMYRNEIQDSLKKGEGASIRYSNTLKTDMLYYAARSGEYIIRLAKPLDEIDRNLSKLRNMIVMSALVALVLAFIIIILISRTITVPIRNTIKFAEQFSSGDYSKRIYNYSDDEIGILQKALNRLADEIVDKINILTFEQEKLKITIQSIQDGIAVIDTQKKLQVANKAFNDLLNIELAPVGETYFEVIRNSSLNSKIDYALLKGEIIYFEEELRNGVICDVFINPVQEENLIRGVLVVVHDITEKKRIDRIKTDLVGNLSHELKTPVAILKGYLETVIEQVESQELKDYLKRALVNVDRQNLIITDMLKLNLLETTAVPLNEKINLYEVIMNSIEILGPKVKSRGLEMKTSIDVVNESVTGNRFLAEGIFFNIIDNAINYNMENGSITITAEKYSNDRKKITVADTGIGIPEDLFERVFERFYRVDKSRSRATGGTGLGLSIVKHSAELLGWEIEISSSGTGSSFILTT